MSQNGTSHTKVTRSFVARTVHSLPPSGIRKFFDLLSSMEGVISLGIGEPDFVTPWHIREAAIYALERGYTMYTSNRGLPELRQQLARHLESWYGLQYDPESELLITVGVSEALDLALRATLNPGDEVLIPEPCFVAYPACTILAGGTAVVIPTREEHGFEIKARDIEPRITSRTKAILIASPANPTGAVVTKKELLKIAELAQQHDLMVISDEVYSRLVYGVEHTCFSALPGMRDRTILLNGFSKAYAMTGWRIGYAAASAEISGAMTKIHQYTIMCASIMAQTAAIEALKVNDGEVEEMVRDYDRRRRVMVEGLCNIGLSCFEPRGAFYAFPSVRNTGMSSEEFAEKLLLEEKVAVVPGSAFGQCGEGYVRCCYATSLPEIQEALRRMGDFVTRHRKA